MSIVSESRGSCVDVPALAAPIAPVGEVASIACVPLFSHWRWSVEKYHEMVRTGIIVEDDPVELLEGWIVQKMTKSPLHRKVTHALRKVLERCIPEGWYVDSQEPVTLAESEPEPDAVVVRRNSDDFGDRHPGPGDIALEAEVTDSSLPRDRVFKKNIYAAAGIAVYWAINLVDRQIEGYADCIHSPSGPDYARCNVYTPADNVPLVIDSRTVAEIPVRAILP